MSQTREKTRGELAFCRREKGKKENKKTKDTYMRGNYKNAQKQTTKNGNKKHWGPPLGSVSRG